ncbi:hypothetical protein A8L34_07040 [Bacillus sp. FJAT-27264]|uniref:plastocyanin/azurin family copper-binding protein n=1 Tax=Paenibacillus sp. (strain DSM 101736 / FJAT-27264) TaxID=1850362 RepID=UPI000807E8C9|nr:plastocyanin/azurin family copper-binding protein [Bacillus sp. FJAT-27264]OBZ19265.1 hypothetical protein A8L34_07040 [Bacillus sp. FJAT-27264]
MKIFGKMLAVLSLGATLIIPGLASAADSGASSVRPGGSDVKTDVQTAAELKLLIGDGQGVDGAYLAKGTTRIQAAIISLRLQGKLEQAASFSVKSNFDDAKLVNSSNQKILAFLHSNPQYGWIGEKNNRFNPLAPVSSQQLYKVLLEVLGFKADKDFAYSDTQAFASGKGLNGIAGVSALTNDHVATALVESLSAQTPAGQPLFNTLQSQGVLPASAKLPAGERLSLRSDAKLGSYLADAQGRTLYYFASDAQNLDACQGQCLANWPVLDSEQLQIPSGLSPADFSLVTHGNGAKQWMYKGWPLYRFIKDSKAGDVLGEGVGGVWFVAKPDYKIMLGANTELGKYLTDAEGRTLYYFAKDMPQMSVCSDQCIVNWPALAAGKGVVPSVLKSDDFGMITRQDESKQATYKGAPLYYFAKDMKHGDVNGQNFGQVWFVIDPSKFTGSSAVSQSAEPTPDKTEAVKTYKVNIKDFSFGSAPLTVEAGSKIVFTNQDDMQHNAVAVNGSFATTLLSKGQSYTITLDKPGTYDYFCELHKSFMTGKIIVT